MIKNEDLFFADESNDGLDTLMSTICSFFKNGSLLMLPAVFLFSSDMALGHNETLLDDNQLVIVAEKNKTTEAVSGKESLRVWNRLQELSQLKDGWDGLDSRRINHRVIEQVQDLLFTCSDIDLMDWVLFPEARGYLYLDYSHQGNMAGISLCEGEFSFFTIHDGNTKKGESIPFKPEKVISVLREFNG